MATVKELIERLQQLPQDAIVEVIKVIDENNTTSTYFAPVYLEHVYELDYRDTPYHGGKCFIQLEAK